MCQKLSYRRLEDQRQGVKKEWIEMLVGAADMGQGVFSTLAQIAATTLPVPIECIRVRTPYTSEAPMPVRRLLPG